MIILGTETGESGRGQAAGACRPNAGLLASSGLAQAAAPKPGCWARLGAVVAGAPIPWASRTPAFCYHQWALKRCEPHFCFDQTPFAQGEAAPFRPRYNRCGHGHRHGTTRGEKEKTNHLGQATSEEDSCTRIRRMLDACGHANVAQILSLAICGFHSSTQAEESTRARPSR